MNHCKVQAKMPTIKCKPSASQTEYKPGSGVQAVPFFIWWSASPKCKPLECKPGSQKCKPKKRTYIRVCVRTRICACRRVPAYPRVRACVHAYVRVCVYACIRACVGVGVRAYTRGRVCGGVPVCAYVYA